MSAIRVFSRSGVSDMAKNLGEILHERSTKPAELLICAASIAQGVMCMMPSDLFDRFSSYRILAKYIGQTNVGLIDVSLSLFLMYSLIGYKREKSDMPDVPDHMLTKIDSYFGNNKGFTMLRRNAILMMIGWMFCLSMMLFCATPIGTGWIAPGCFCMQLIWALARLRTDESDVRRYIGRRDSAKSLRLTDEAVTATFDDHVFRRCIEDRDAPQRYRAILPVRGGERDASGQVG